MKQRNKTVVPAREVNELVDLCNAWLCILLRRLGEGEHRFSLQEFREGMGRLRLHISREDGDYVLRLTETVSEGDGREAQHVGDEA